MYTKVAFEAPHGAPDTCPLAHGTRIVVNCVTPENALVEIAVGLPKKVTDFKAFAPLDTDNAFMPIVWTPTGIINDCGKLYVISKAELPIVTKLLGNADSERYDLENALESIISMLSGNVEGTYRFSELNADLPMRVTVLGIIISLI